jgi:hypothetical protein
MGNHRKRMIIYTLKLWSNNTEWFDEAVRLYNDGAFSALEVYHNSVAPIDHSALATLKEIPVVGVHHGRHTAKWHEFFLTDDQRSDWEGTVALADFFNIQNIIVHPARSHSVETLFENLEKLNDSRILIENMSGLDIDSQEMECGQTLGDLTRIREKYNICFDFEKAYKASIHQSIPFKQFVDDALAKLQPVYFHISGGDAKSAVDEHTDLWDADMDIGWIRARLEKYTQDTDAPLVFETPKNGTNIDNDIANMDYFRKQ